MFFSKKHQTNFKKYHRNLSKWQLIIITNNFNLHQTNLIFEKEGGQ